MAHLTTARAGIEHIGVGIDTARYAHHVSFLTPDRQEATRAIMVEESGDGYRKLQSVLEKLKKKYPHVHFHIHVDVEQPSASERISDEFYILREIAGRLQSHVKNTTQAINRLHNLLARVFPELGAITPNVAASWVLTLLTKYPTPERIARATQSSLAQIPCLGSEKATTWYGDTCSAPPSRPSPTIELSARFTHGYALAAPVVMWP